MDGAGALARWARRACLARPHGHVRVFLDEGPPLTAISSSPPGTCRRRGTRLGCWPWTPDAGDAAVAATAGGHDGDRAGV